MIYATTIVGKKFCNQFAEHINLEGSKRTLFVYTDHPELFPKCNTRLYTRKVFSYFEKLTFMLELVIEHRRRVSFVDADWCKDLKGKVPFDKHVVYSWNVYNYAELHNMGFYQDGIDLTNSLLKEKGFEHDSKLYPAEAILSFPYLGTVTERILEQLVSLQPIWEETFNQDLRLNKKLNRYAGYGIGYCEGGALYGVLMKNYIEVKTKGRDEYHNKSLM